MRSRYSILPINMIPKDNVVNTSSFRNYQQESCFTNQVRAKLTTGEDVPEDIFIILDGRISALISRTADVLQKELHAVDEIKQHMRYKTGADELIDQDTIDSLISKEMFTKETDVVAQSIACIKPDGGYTYREAFLISILGSEEAARYAITYPEFFGPVHLG
jgi:hypothetical protein